MAIAPTAATISVAQTIALLDGPFKAVADGVAEGRYAFWLGSGISFGRVDGLKQLIPRLLEFLRARIEPTVPGCRFKAAMNAALALAALTDDERQLIDMTAPFTSWPVAESITSRLVNNYARLLDVQVAGEPADYLVWNGVDVPGTYAAAGKEPDVEHVCIALLVLEGAATELATANWDGLIEKAADELTGGQPLLVACVRREDLQSPAQRAWLYKFHGCAVQAVANEATYRPFIIARASQINGWIARPENQALANRLVGLITSKPTLMLGLSAQDPNIQVLFAHAESHSPWAWPGDRPSFVFSGDQIGADQQGMLQNVYRTSLTPANLQQVIDGAVIRSYAKPLLIALTLHVLCAKLRRLIDLATAALSDTDRTHLHAGVLALRDLAASVANGDRLAFLKDLINISSRCIGLYRDGRAGTPPRRYHPLTTTPLHHIQNDAAIPASGLREFAVALAILGIVVRDGHWELELGDPADAASGVAIVTSALGSARLLFATNSHTALLLQHNGHVADEDAILVHSAEMLHAMPRSPRAAPGRTGKLATRQVSMRDLLSVAKDSRDLVQTFREAVAI